MKLVVGLGNPGRRYQDTRHNVGFMVLGELARKYSVGAGSIGKVRNRFQGETIEAEAEGEKLLLLTPTTYMNLSGASVLAAKDFYKIATEDVLAVCDDMNLPLAKLRARASGSAGGQKGLEDIIRRLGTDAIPRLRIGIGAAPDGWAWADYVLSKFTKEEVPIMEQAVVWAAEAVGVWAREGIQACMTRYNG